MLIKYKKKDCNRGYIILEAAVFLPVFLFSMVLLIYMIKVMHLQEIVHYESSRELAVLSRDSQYGGASFGKRMYENRVYHNVQDKVEKEINISGYVSDDEEVLLADVSYPIELDMPFGLFDDIKIRDVLVSRKWSGRDSDGRCLEFSEMEKEDTKPYVYIFPKYGERYHDVDCRYLSIEGRYFRTVELSYALSKGYLGCEICR